MVHIIEFYCSNRASTNQEILTCNFFCIYTRCTTRRCLSRRILKLHILIIFLFGMPFRYNVFFSNKEDRGIVLLYTRISRKSKVNCLTANARFVFFRNIATRLNLFDCFFQYTYIYMFYNNMCNVVFNEHITL